MTTTPPPAAAAESDHPFRLLADKLGEIFQIDRGDLDFGIYRILNTKSAEIRQFLNHDLLPQVRAELDQFASDQTAALQRQLADAKKKAADLDMPAEDVPKVRELQQQLQMFAGGGMDEVEKEVYSHLLNFFSRYYRNGDFMSQRRYKEGVYAIPYSGQEVKLHWANCDQYYVKTAENFNRYVFCPDAANGANASDADNGADGDTPRRVVFQAVRADLERDNNNGNGKRFVLAKDPVLVQGDELRIAFEWRKPDERKNQRQLNEAAEQAILAAIPADWRPALRAQVQTGDKANQRTVLRKHLNVFTAKNTFDYFIHKDLGGFLRRELDFFIKNEVVQLDNLDHLDVRSAVDYLARARALRAVAHKVIDFAAQLENFQKRLWEKKKFILRTNYCLTLNRLPKPSDMMYSTIVACQDQWQEWVTLNFCDAKTAGADHKTRMAFLAANPTLPIDTANFDDSFKDELLSSFDDIDGITDGLLIHGDNWQALNLLQTQFKGRVQCVYIDPPYNTDMSPILYKNNYKHSAWMSLIDNGVSLAGYLLSDNGAFAVAIDDAELYHLKLLLDHSLGETNHIGTVVVQSNPGGRDINSHFAICHEYCLFYANSGQKDMLLPRANGYEEEKKHLFRRTGGLSTPDERPNSEFAIYYIPATLKIVGIGGKRSEPYPSPYKPSSVHCFDDAGENEELSPSEFFAKFPQVASVLPEFKKRDERGVWRWSDREKIMAAVKAGSIYISVHKSDVNVNLVTEQSPYFKLKTIWGESQFSATSHGTNLLQNLFGEKFTFSYPKSIHTVVTAVGKMLFDEGQRNYSFEAAERVVQSVSLDKSEFTVLDYFAGSGTTAEAVIRLNRQDGGRRKFILVEAGEHFNTVILPRIKKVIFSPEWKNGAPRVRATPDEAENAPRLIKHFALESYDDTLANLKRPDHALSNAERGVLATDPTEREVYMLHYLLDADTNNSVALLRKDNFSHPFNTTLQTVRDGKTLVAPVDLPETFNHLLGLHVKTRRFIDGVLVVTGQTRQGEKTHILWRDIAAMPNDKLNAWLQDHMPDADFDIVYVNGNHLINQIKPDNARWTAEQTEPVLRRLMFEEGV